MSTDSTYSPSRGPAVFVGILAAFASFAVIAALLQAIAGGKPADPTSAKRLENKAAVAKEQNDLLVKYGLAGAGADAVIAKAADQVKARKQGPSTIVVPNSPTAQKQQPAAPAAAPAAPAAPAPAPAK